MNDPIYLALQLLDAEAPKKGIVVQPDQLEPRRRSYIVPTTDGRKQVVNAVPVYDSLFGERLDLVSVASRGIPPDVGLLFSLLAAARGFRRCRLCTFDRGNPQLVVVASFVPDEIHEGVGMRLLHACREVASVADSLERQLIGEDIE